ncbi:MAG: NAD-dependent DNA ligase LigA [bacterium]|nr:NAD-dependent DNA ligase LigA [Candidatus Minthenecus merdequi]
MKEIDDLRRELREYNHSYYVLNQPQISDKEFDMKMKKLEQLEAEHPECYDADSPTLKVGSDLQKGFVQVEHRYPMLSLGNTYSEGEVRDWYIKTKKLVGKDFDVVCELKFDGTSISVIYENGRLVRGVTRGDGKVGDDVTRNVAYIQNVPKFLTGDYPVKVEFRGEVLMPWSSFDRLNREREEQQEQLFANPRNAASGTLKLLDSKEVWRRGLQTYIYYTLGEELPLKTHYEQLQKTREWGMNVSSDMKLCHSLEEIMEYIKHWDEARKELPVATDGIVLKVNDFTLQEKLGYTAKNPRWAIAYKFQPEQALTRLEAVTYQVGRTGVVTPVANLEAVLLSGTMVRRATLHNEDFVRALDLHESDMVYVEKGGEIIPKITAVDKSQRDKTAKRIEFIDKCPVCNTKLVRNDEESAWYCPNETGCAPQIRGRMEHFVSRKAMNIDGIGSEIITNMYETGIATSIEALYSLTYNDLRMLDGFADKSARNVLAELAKSREVPYERVLFAIGIRNVGEVIAKKLAARFRSIDELRNATVEEMTEVEDIGEKIARNVIAFFAEPKNISMIETLRQYGLKMKSEEEKVVVSDRLSGMTIVVSGKFEMHSREEYKAMIESNGGKNGSSVSAKTTYILAGSDMGPAKREKAEKLGVKIINENEFAQLLKEKED